MLIDNSNIDSDLLAAKMCLNVTFLKIRYNCYIKYERNNASLRTNRGDCHDAFLQSFIVVPTSASVYLSVDIISTGKCHYPHCILFYCIFVSQVPYLWFYLHRKPHYYASLPYPLSIEVYNVENQISFCSYFKTSLCLITMAILHWWPNKNCVCFFFRFSGWNRLVWCSTFLVSCYFYRENILFTQDTTIKCLLSWPLFIEAFMIYRL